MACPHLLPKTATKTPFPATVWTGVNTVDSRVGFKHALAIKMPQILLVYTSHGLEIAL